MLVKNLTTLTLTILVLGGASLHSVGMGPTAAAPFRTAEASMVSLTLIGTFTAWNASTIPNPTITVTQGDTVRIALTSTDTTHQFALDVDRDGTKFIGACPTGDTCSPTFNPTTGTTVTFNAPAAGTYTYFCTFHPAMVGSFVVKAPSQSSTATFVHGKLSWTHHLSLVKTTSTQTFTATVEDTGSANTMVIVHVSGVSGTAFSASSNAETLQPGLVTLITFTSAVSSTLVGTKVCFTASLTFGPNGVGTTSPVTKDGCFAVVS